MKSSTPPKAKDQLPPAPFFTHKGVKVFHVYQREMYPFTFHFSWSMTRKDGTKERPGECFDIRELPGYSDQATPPQIYGEPRADELIHEGKTMWMVHKRTMQRNFLAAYIDTCIKNGRAPWAEFQARDPEVKQGTSLPVERTNEVVLFRREKTCVMIALSDIAWRELRRKKSAIATLAAAFDTQIRAGQNPDQRDVFVFNNDPRLLIVGLNRIAEVTALAGVSITEGELIALLKSVAT